MSDDRKSGASRRGVLQAALGGCLSPFAAIKPSMTPNTLLVRGMIVSYLRDRGFVASALR